MAQTASQEPTEPRSFRPELHLTAETGVLEAPAGAIVAGGAMHVFQQFRPTAHEGSRWGHQVASGAPYDWDIRDDVLAPRTQDGEVDVLAGSAIEVGPSAAELFFVVATGARRGAEHSEEHGQRHFHIHRARMADVDAHCEISDDPKQVDPTVERLGPIDIEDSAHPIRNLVTPSVIPASEGWIMMALNLLADDDAEIVLLHSADRQHWVLSGVLDLPPEAGLPTARRPYAPRLARIEDQADGEVYDVVFLTFPGEAGEPEEIAGYVVGHVEGTHFSVRTPFTVLDYGHDFTRPRIIPAPSPLMLGLVGARPSGSGQWANCLSAPRFLSLVDGAIYQDIIGTPSAITGYSDHALLWTGQLDANGGRVDVTIRDAAGGQLVEVGYAAGEVSVTRGNGDSRTAPLAEADSDTLAVFVDGPVCEVFADGGAVSLTSAIPSGTHPAAVVVNTYGDAEVRTAMVTAGQQIQRAQAGLGSPDEHDAFLAAALQADRELSSEWLEENGGGADE
ncbi:hydrolase [Corynebacterium heidelbergense]|uniref:beta-fructofuranosidase n=1 Tax=Corynebacterium heidelbergense TaxID=2055947 RepID=A0A364VDY3_9CORY|nr:hydrolase [Corynebacterium heidelbergense]RAV34859.1 hydrolase [Corynebacterium heidelbergense]WCZ36942.1 hypothetical protein CHEID_07045 [Corynebacterium heidelbergense]